MTDIALFWAKVQKTDTCWFWTGAVQTNGYGCWSRDGKRVLTHRVAYVELVGPIPEGLQIDHLCRKRLCCNPAHLEPVTAGENIRRGEPATRTRCIHGHDYTPENTIRTGSKRACRECQNAGRRLHPPGLGRKIGGAKRRLGLDDAAATALILAEIEAQQPLSA